MAVLTSAILGAITSFAPEVIKLLNRKADTAREIELRKLDIQLQREANKNETYLADLKSVVDEGKSLRDHDSDLNGGKFINGLRASVRPIITYFFFLLFVGIKIAGLYLVINSMDSEYLSLSNAWREVYPLVWGEDEMSIFAAVMGFWFGSRAVNQMSRVDR